MQPQSTWLCHPGKQHKPQDLDAINVNNASKINSKRATPHGSENNHDKQPAGGIRDVPQRIFAGIEYVVIGVIET